MTPGACDAGFWRSVAGNVTIWQIGHMDRDQIIAKLREYKPELKAAGVEHLFLHGSYARGTAIRELSDVDVISSIPADGYPLWTWLPSRIALPTCSASVWICPLPVR